MSCLCTKAAKVVSLQSYLLNYLYLQHFHIMAVLKSNKQSKPYKKGRRLEGAGTFSFLFEHFLTFWHYKVLQAYLVYFLPLSLKQPFLQRTLIPFDRAWSSLGQKLDCCCHLGLVMAKVISVLYFCLLCYVNLHLFSLKRLLLAELCPLKFMC